MRTIVRLRAPYMRWLLAAATGGLLIGAPAHGQGAPAAAIVASDFAFKTGAGATANVTVAPGSTVSFAYPSGDEMHNVVFTGPQPSSCRQLQPPSTLSSAPLPATPSGPGWQGDCTFAAEGTYAFVCGKHGAMTGSVQVTSGGGVTPPPPPAAAPPPPPPAGSLAAAASGLRVAAAQRGSAIRGSVRVTRAGSRLLARAFARRRALSGGRSTRLVEVGRQLRGSVGAGRVTFSVRLGPSARRALRRDGRLAITLRLRVTPQAGASFAATRAVVLRPPA